MVSKMDIIQCLLDRHMYFVVKEIFDHLNEDNLRVCESVSDHWSLAIKNCKMWSKLYQKQQTSFVIRALMQRMHSIQWSHLSFKSEECLFKKLFNDRVDVEKNWLSGIYYTDEAKIDNCNVITMAFDTKRILFGVIPVSYFGPSKIIVCNRWTLQVECVLHCPIKQWISNLQIDGDNIFCSHIDGNIVIWDLKTREIIMDLNKEELWQWKKSCLSHGFFVACYFIDPPPDLVISIRRTRNPISEMTVEKVVHIPGVVLRNIDIDENYLVLSLCRSSYTVYKIQIRSTRHDFQIIHELDFSYDPFYNYVYGNGYLVAALLEGGHENMKLWDISTMELITSWYVNQRKSDRRTNFIGVTRSRLITKTTNNRKFNVYDLNSLSTMKVLVSKPTQPNVLYQIKSKLHDHVLVDDIQLIIISKINVTSSPMMNLLTTYNFVSPLIKLNVKI